MASVKERVSSRVRALRERRPFVDHVLRAFQHYSDRNGNAQAGAVTFFGFLSFFPLLALAFLVVGWLSQVFPRLRREVVEALQAVLPGVVGTGPDQIPLSTFEQYASTVGWISGLILLYTGLGWVSAMRRGLAVMFRVPEQEQLGFLRGKARDSLALCLLGVVLVLSISLSGTMAWFSGAILEWLGLSDLLPATLGLWLVVHGLAVAASTVLFMALFALVPKPHVARRALWQGAFAGSLGFEVLKSAAEALIALTKGQAAFAAFGIALIVVLWINYFSRLVMLSAAWAYTAPLAAQLRELAGRPLVTEEETEALSPAPAAVAAEDPDDAPLPWARSRRHRVELAVAASAAGAAVMAVLTWLGRRRRS